MKLKKALFIDRDGTLIIEPPVTYQVNNLEELEFLPFVFKCLNKIVALNEYELVMVTNQDALGTPIYPQENFDAVQNKMLAYLKNEGIVFNDILIDKSTPEQKLPTRKPGTAMLTDYMIGNYDLANSFVIGDRITDVLLAKNMGAKAILIAGKEMLSDIKKENLEDVCCLITLDWNEIYQYVALPSRTASVSRKTKETDIDIFLNLDGKGNTDISTGLHFFDHMLDQIGKHSGIDLKIKVSGDLQVDEHHTIEDTGIALGEAIYKALGNKLGVQRYGFLLPMDDCLAQVAIDFGGRPWLVWDAPFHRERVGDVPTEMFFHFFKSFSDASKCNLNIKAEGENEHHKAEAIFKGLAKALKMALKRDADNMLLPSTKGVL